MLLGAIVGFALGGTIMSWGHWAKAPSSAAVTSASSAPSTVAFASAEPVDKHERWSLEHRRAIERKDTMITRCEKEGGTAAIGFGARVVCVKPMWVANPEFPEWE
jgi:hypothetical protein